MLAVFVYLYFLAVFESNFVLVTDCTHDRILQVSLDTGELNKIPINATGAAGITFDKSTQTIFFTSSKYMFSSKVMSVSLHGQYGQWNINTYASGNHANLLSLLILNFYLRLSYSEWHMILVRKTCWFVIDITHCINCVVRETGDVVFFNL